jgi:hypothetical protein
MQSNDPVAEKDRTGLCASCQHARCLSHPRGGDSYWLCTRSEADSRFPKYPRLPVLVCDGYETGKSGVD